MIGSIENSCYIQLKRERDRSFFLFISEKVIYFLTNSTRRFLARPSVVSLEAMGE